jgi:hypothetical protein
MDSPRQETVFFLYFKREFTWAACCGKGVEEMAATCTNYTVAANVTHDATEHSLDINTHRRFPNLPV